MLIKAGYTIAFQSFAPTPVVALLSVHPSRKADLVYPARIQVTPPLDRYDFLDEFGNTATRLVMQPGTTTLHSEFLIRDSGLVDARAPDVALIPLAELPDDVLPYLKPSRYCESDSLLGEAWSRFGGFTSAREMADAITAFAHSHISFGYHFARNNRTAADAWHEGVGVCRDYAHLAVALCRAMNLPARYCTGYLGDIGVPVSDAPMDFSAWFEVYIGGEWYTYDARHNAPRIGRVLMARGRDASDAAITTMFGAANLERFEVVTLEMDEQASAAA